MALKQRLARPVFALLVLAGVALFASANTAYAQDDNGGPKTPKASKKFDALIASANKAYTNKNYTEAVRLFEEAYALEAQSNILYNIGRTYERAGQIKDAVSFYDRFLVAPDVDSDLRRDALDRRKLLGEVLALRASEKKQAEVTAPEQEKAVVVPQEPPNKGSEIVPWVLIGAGGVSILTSAIFIGVTASHADTYDDQTAAPGERIDAKDSGETTALIADITMGMGIVSVTTGLVWYFIGSESNPAATRASNNSGVGTLTPMVGEHTSGVMWQVDFQ